MATAEGSAADYIDLRNAVMTLEHRIAPLESRLSNDGRRAVTVPDIHRLEADIVRITQEIFPGNVSIGFLHDPETPEESFPVVEAEATGEIREIVTRRMAWHQRIRNLAPGLSLPISLAIRQ